MLTLEELNLAREPLWQEWLKTDGRKRKLKAALKAKYEAAQKEYVDCLHATYSRPLTSEELERLNNSTPAGSVTADGRWSFSPPSKTCICNGQDRDLCPSKACRMSVDMHNGEHDGV